MTIDEGAEMTADLATEPRWTPPGWMNRMMAGMLVTPVLQRIVGRSTALLTFVGRTSGRRITTPVSYVTVDDHIVLTGHRTRQWWRNVAANPEVELRLAGVTRRGIATVVADPDLALDEFVRLLEEQPVVARISDVALDSQGRADRTRARTVLEYTVVVTVELLAE